MHLCVCVCVCMQAVAMTVVMNAKGNNMEDGASEALSIIICIRKI